MFSFSRRQSFLGEKDKIRFADVPAVRGVMSTFWLLANDPTAIVKLIGVIGLMATGPSEALATNTN